MKRFAFISSAAVFALTSCVKVSTTEPAQEPEFVTIRATVTSDNHCNVEALGLSYQSIGNVSGATPPMFVGTLDNAGYHAIGCWMYGPNGSDGVLTITFPGNSLNQPFRTGTFKPVFEPPFGSSDDVASVTFRSSSYNAEMLRTVGTSTGTVTVTASPSGARTIVVDVTAIRYQT
jgi:hypothetical protein